MANRLTIPGLKVPKLSGWPLVGIIGVGLAVVALAYGGATGNLDNSCTMTVQADRVAVRSAPAASGATTGETLTRGTEVGAQQIVDSGYRKLSGSNRWVPANAVAATSGSVC